MRSIGLFVKQKINDKSNKMLANSDLIEIHINLWNVRTKDGGDFYAIDFGFKYNKNVDAIKLVLPFEAEQDDFTDLAHVLTNNKSLLCTVFNADMSISSEQSDSIHVVENHDSKEKIAIYELSARNIVWKPFDKESNSTELTIKPQYDENHLKEEKVYVRFRIKLHNLNMFAHTRKLSNDLIQSAFSSTRLFDIRLNDKREIDKKLIEGIMFDKYKMVIIEKMHFFYMADAEETLENGSNIPLGTRMLEKERWNPYLGDREMNDEYLAYHWKLNSRVKGKSIDPYSTFSVFFKTSYTSYDVRRIFKYSIIVILLSFLGSLIVSVFFPYNEHRLYGFGIIALFCFVAFCLILKSCYEDSARS